MTKKEKMKGRLVPSAPVRVNVAPRRFAIALGWRTVRFASSLVAEIGIAAEAASGRYSAPDFPDDEVHDVHGHTASNHVSVVITAAWTGIFATDFDGNDPQRNAPGLPTTSEIGAASRRALLAVIRPAAASGTGSEAHGRPIRRRAARPGSALVTYLQECIRDSQTDSNSCRTISTEMAAIGGPVQRRSRRPSPTLSGTKP